MAFRRIPFQPTDQMTALVEHLREHDYACTITEACEAVDISRQAYYQWFTRPEFVDWWSSQQEQHFMLATGRVQGATLRAATKEPGSNSDRKLFLERFDPQFARRGKAAELTAGTFEAELAEMEANAASETLTGKEGDHDHAAND